MATRKRSTKAKSKSLAKSTRKGVATKASKVHAKGSKVRASAYKGYGKVAGKVPGYRHAIKSPVKYGVTVGGAYGAAVGGKAKGAKGAVTGAAVGAAYGAGIGQARKSWGKRRPKSATNLMRQGAGYKSYYTGKKKSNASIGKLTYKRRLKSGKVINVKKGKRGKKR